MGDVTLPDGQPAYATLPPGAKRGLVVIHELAGMQPEVKQAVDRIAEQGYAVVAPDLFAGRFRPMCLIDAQVLFRQGKGPFSAKIDTAKAWLAEQAKLSDEHLGVLGFCMGGSLALAVGSRFASVSTNYGEVPPDERLEGIPPTIGCYGGRDRLYGKNGALLEERLRARGVEVETHLFPAAGHGFLTEGHHPVQYALTRPFLNVRYDAQVAEEAWRKIFAFFDRHL
jgi:carboxymethylenebutenolidase